MRALVTIGYKPVYAAAVVALSLVVAGCGGGGETPREVVLVTHDSFAISKEVKTAFEEESGLTLRVLQGGDANEMLNRALLTAGDPQGDVIFGIDDSSSHARSTEISSRSTRRTSSRASARSTPTRTTT